MNTTAPISKGHHVPGGVLTKRTSATFEVHLDVFNGPFDLLLGLIAKHALDITEIALASVTDEFMVHMNTLRESDPHWNLDIASDFLLVAATLLDIKAARLLPVEKVDDEEDFALIEARDLLFARLLQYRGYQRVAQWMGERMQSAGRAEPRRPGADPVVAGLLPEIILGVGPDAFGAIAATALTPKAPPQVEVEHLHAATVSVPEQGRIVVEVLREHITVSFSDLVADAASTMEVVARFLSLLELFRAGSVGFDQPDSLGPLTVRWVGPMSGSTDDVVPPAWTAHKGTRVTEQDWT